MPAHRLQNMICAGSGVAALILMAAGYPVAAKEAASLDAAASKLDATSSKAATSERASADIRAPAPAALGNPSGDPARTDAKFKQLFESWATLDDQEAEKSAQLPGNTAIAIPSAMPLRTARLTSGYGMRKHPVLGRQRHHNGVDLAAPTGTPVYATADGVVARADRSYTYGLVVYLGHGAQLETRYAHMSRLLVNEGERVQKGEMIGYVGSTGRSTGPHLHYEVRMAGKSVNPIPYMIESKAQQHFALVTGEGGRGGE